MSNQSPNPDHALHHESPSSEGSTASLNENLVESVLADARQLLDTLGAGIEEEGTGTPDSEAQTAEDGFDPGSVATVLDRVENLVGDFERLDEAVEDQSRSEPFDLTAIASKPPASPEEQVPSHGPNGPEVDLFAAEPVVEPSSEPAVNPALGFESVAEVEDKGTDDAVAALKESTLGHEPADPDAPSGDAAVRLEQLLADRLAEEFDVVEDLGQQESTVPVSDDVEVMDSEPVEHRAMEDSNEPEDRTEFKSIETDDHELGLSSTRVIPAVDPESVEMTAIPGGPEASDRVEMTAIDDEEDDPIAPKMVKVTAEDAPSDPGSERTPDPAEAVASVVAVPAEETIDSDVMPTEDPSSATEDEETIDTALPEAVASVAEGDSGVEVESDSVLLAIATLPYRILPESFHRFVTPLALSLAIWVPIAWTFAVVGPQPSVAATENLQPGFEGREAVPDDVSASTDDAGDEERG